jgi:hypothetical protein
MSGWVYAIDLPGGRAAGNDPSLHGDDKAGIFSLSCDISGSCTRSEHVDLIGV